MPWIVGAASLAAAGFDSWLKWRENDRQEKLFGKHTLVLAAVIAAAMLIAAKAVRR